MNVEDLYFHSINSQKNLLSGMEVEKKFDHQLFYKKYIFTDVDDTKELLKNLLFVDEINEFGRYFHQIELHIMEGDVIYNHSIHGLVRERGNFLLLHFTSVPDFSKYHGPFLIDWNRSLPLAKLPNEKLEAVRNPKMIMNTSINCISFKFDILKISTLFEKKNIDKENDKEENFVVINVDKSEHDFVLEGFQNVNLLQNLKYHHVVELSNGNFFKIATENEQVDICDINFFVPHTGRYQIKGKLSIEGDLKNDFKKLQAPLTQRFLDEGYVNYLTCKNTNFRVLCHEEHMQGDRLFFEKYDFHNDHDNEKYYKNYIMNFNTHGWSFNIEGGILLFSTKINSLDNSNLALTSQEKFIQPYKKEMEHCQNKVLMVESEYRYTLEMMTQYQPIAEVLESFIKYFILENDNPLISSDDLIKFLEKNDNPILEVDVNEETELDFELTNNVQPKHQLQILQLIAENLKSQKTQMEQRKPLDENHEGNQGNCDISTTGINREYAGLLVEHDKQEAIRKQQIEQKETQKARNEEMKKRIEEEENKKEEDRIRKIREENDLMSQPQKIFSLNESHAHDEEYENVLKAFCLRKNSKK